MPGNKHTTDLQTEQIFNRLDLLMEDMQTAYAGGLLETEGEIIEEFNKALSEYSKQLQTPHFDPKTIKQGEEPDSADYNDNMSSLQKDLNVLFKELTNAQNLILGNFNYMVAQGDKLTRLSKSVSSKLGDLALFSGDPLKRAIYFKDSFNDASKLEIGSPLLLNSQAELNDAEGILTLSVERGTNPTVRPNTLIINTNSNGTIGNNQELGAGTHGDINVINDSNPDTWFEYETVSRRSLEDETLKLDLTFTFDNEEILNFIQINPNNFGTENPIKIETIETSRNGKEFTSIKDDIPVGDFVIEDEDNVFSLAPSTSKFAGQGLYSFSPRKVKYAHIVFSQSNPYPIETSTGTKFRLAIGLRDIDFQRLTYAEQSEAVSTLFQTSNEIKKVAILANENPAEASDLADIEHQISPDDGATWYKIQPKARTGTEIAEVLSFNLDVDAGIQTPIPVFSLRHRALLSRNPTAFEEGAYGLTKVVVPEVDIVQVAGTSPFEVVLSKGMADANTTIVDPNFGSRGKKKPRFFLGSGNGTSVTIPLPQEIVGNVDQADIEVFVNGKRWSRVGLLANAASDAEAYQLTEEEILFGDNVGGKAVPSGSEITLSLTSEQVFPSIDDTHVFELKIPCDGDKQNTIITRVGEEKEVVEQPILGGVTNYALGKRNVVTSIVNNQKLTGAVVKEVKPNGTLGSEYTEQEFQDGVTELTAPGHFSIDDVQGIFYTRGLTHSIYKTSISYKYLQQEVVDSGQWDFDTTDTEKRKISLKEGAYEDIEVEGFIVEADATEGISVVDLKTTGIVKKSISFGDASNIFVDGSGLPEEVEFTGDTSELSSSSQLTETLSLINVLTDETGGNKIYTSLLSQQGNLDPRFNINFGNSAFSNRVDPPTGLQQPADVLLADGDYFVITSGTGVGNFYVRHFTAFDTDLNVDVTYHFHNLAAEDSFNRKFSVDYDNGKIYFSRPIKNGTVIDFNHTKYYVSYNVSKVLPSDTYQVNLNTNSIRFNEDEILRSLIGDGRTDRKPSVLKVFYNSVQESREDLTELEPYFSPVLKDYALKIVTADKLI